MPAAVDSGALYDFEAYLDPNKSWTEQEEAQLSQLLAFSASQILNRAYPFRETLPELPARYAALQIQIAAELYNRMGNEGQIVHNENGINRTWASDEVSQGMLRQIVPEVGVVGYDASVAAE